MAAQYVVSSGDNAVLLTFKKATGRNLEAIYERN
jgi:hypothetical protein